MIVKVQLAIPNRERVLIYNQHKDYEFEEAITPDDPLIKMMDGEYKAYFHAIPVKNKEKSTGKEKHCITISNSLDEIRINKPRKGKTTYTIEIQGKAPWQSW